MRRHDEGYAMVYLLLASLFFTALMSVNATTLYLRAENVGQVTRETTHNAALQSNLSYLERLSVSNASRWANTAGTNIHGHGNDLRRDLQEAADATVCSRTIPGSQVLIFFTTQACGTALPSGIDLDSVVKTPSESGNMTTWYVPFVLVTTNDAGEVASQRKVLRLTDGTSPLSTYAVWSGAHQTISDLSSTGPVYVLGKVSMSSAGDLAELHTAGCVTPAPGCSAQGGLNVDGMSRLSMQLAPTAAQPCSVAGCTGGRVNPRAPVSVPPDITPVSLSLGTVTTLRLGVEAGGMQRITSCQTICTTYLTNGQTLMTEAGTSVGVWSGHVSVLGNVRVQSETPGEPAVALTMTVHSTGNMQVGALTLANPPCSGDDCQPTDDLLGLTSAGAITVDGNATVQGSLYARGRVQGINSEVMGSVAAWGGIQGVRVAFDPRLSRTVGLGPAGWPTLVGAVQQVIVEDGKNQ